MNPFWLPHTAFDGIYQVLVCMDQVLLLFPEFHPGLRPQLHGPHLRDRASELPEGDARRQVAGDDGVGRAGNPHDPEDVPTNGDDRR